MARLLYIAVGGQGYAYLVEHVIGGNSLETRRVVLGVIQHRLVKYDEVGHVQQPAGKLAAQLLVLPNLFKCGMKQSYVPDITFGVADADSTSQVVDFGEGDIITAEQLSEQLRAVDTENNFR